MPSTTINKHSPLHPTTSIRCIDLDTPAHTEHPSLALAEPSVSKSPPASIARLLVVEGSTHKLGRTPTALAVGTEGVLRVSRRYNIGKGRTARQETTSMEVEVVVDPAGMLEVELQPGQPWRFAVEGLRLSDAALAEQAAAEKQERAEAEARAEAAAEARRAMARRFAVVRVDGTNIPVPARDLFERAATTGLDIVVVGDREMGRIGDRRDGRGVVLFASGYSLSLAELES